MDSDRIVGLDVLTTILMDLDQITPEQVEKHASRHLTSIEKSDEVLGVVDDIRVRRLHVLIIRLGGKHLQYVGLSKAAETEEEAKQYESEGDRCRAMDQMLRAMFWAECQGATGYWKQDVGIRSGWTVVKSSNPFSQMSGLFGL